MNTSKREFARKYPTRHAATQKRHSENVIKTNKAKLAELKRAPCADCGVQYPPYVMHYDHRDPSTKLYAIAQMVGTTFSWEKIEAETKKCDLVCSNCHAERTWGPK